MHTTIRKTTPKRQYLEKFNEEPESAQEKINFSWHIATTKQVNPMKL